MSFYDINIVKPGTKIISLQPNENINFSSEKSNFLFFDNSLSKTRQTAIVQPLFVDECTQTDDEDEEQSLLRSRVGLLQQALEEQKTRNDEVKKLLIVSLGNDLASHYTQLMSDLTHTGDRVSSLLNEKREINDNIDEILIEANLWKNKFVAGRILISEFAGWKEQFSLRYQEALDAVQTLLQERQSLRVNLALLNDQLNHTSSHLGLHHSQKYYSNTADLVKHGLEIATKVNDLLSCGVLWTQNGITGNGSIKEIKNYTFGEQSAIEVLTNRTDIHADQSTKYLSSFAAKDGQHLEKMALAICRNCTGDIFVV